MAPKRKISPDSPPADQGQRKLPLPALLVLAAIGFTAITTELLPSGLLPQISRGFGVAESDVGFLTAGYAGIIVLSVIPMTKLTGRVPRKLLLLLLIATFALSNVLIGLSPAFPVAVAARLVGGVAHGLLWSIMAPFVARIVPEDKIGRAMAIVFSGNTLGLAIGAPVGTAVGTLLGWREGFLLLAAAIGLLGLLAVLLLPTATRGPNEPLPSVRRAMRQPGVKAVAIAWPLMLLARFSLFTYIAPFVLAAKLPDFMISLSLSIIGVSGLIGIWLAGMTVDTRPRRSQLVSSAAVVVAYLVLPFSGGMLLLAALLLAVWGGGLGAAGIYNQAAILRAGGEHKEAANCLMVLTTQLGIAVGAVYGGLALTLGGGLLVPLAAAIPAAVSLLLMYLGRSAAYPPGPRERRKGERADQPLGASVS
jgi:predicted MFS family arabinose efflux permease